MPEPSPVAAVPRVLIVHERYREAGGEDVVADLEAALLERHGHAVERLTVDNDDIDLGAGLLGRIRLASDTVWSRSGAQRVRDVVRAFRPTVVHVHNSFPLLSPAIHPAARAEGAATVQTLHNYRLVCVSANLYRDGRPCNDCVGRTVALPGVVHGCYRDSPAASLAVAAMQTVHRVRRTWSRDVDAIVALTRFHRDRLVEGGVPASRIVVKPNFVDVAAPTAAGPGDGFVYVGRLTTDKGVDTLLAAWQGADVPSTLTIIGAGPLESAVRAAAEGTPGIRFLGAMPREALFAEMARSRAVVVPSRYYEGCPMTVLEAYACGRPVIATAHGSLAELVVDGDTGWTFRPADAAHLAERIRQATADPAGSAGLGDRARATYEREFAPERGYERLIEVYRRAIAARARRVAA